MKTFTDMTNLIKNFCKDFCLNNLFREETPYERAWMSRVDELILIRDALRMLILRHFIFFYECRSVDELKIYYNVVVSALGEFGRFTRAPLDYAEMDKIVADVHSQVPHSVKEDLKEFYDYFSGKKKTFFFLIVIPALEMLILTNCRVSWYRAFNDFIYLLATLWAEFLRFFLTLRVPSFICVFAIYNIIFFSWLEGSIFMLTNFELIKLYLVVRVTSRFISYIIWWLNYAEANALVKTVPIVWWAVNENRVFKFKNFQFVSPFPVAWICRELVLVTKFVLDMLDIVLSIMIVIGVLFTVDYVPPELDPNPFLKEESYFDVDDIQAWRGISDF